MTRARPGFPELWVLAIILGAFAAYGLLYLLSDGPVFP